MIPLTPAHSAAHVQPVDARVGASEVGLGTDILAILVRVVTGQDGGGVYTGTGHGLSPTFRADCITLTIPVPGLRGTAPPGWEAAVLVSVLGLECLIPALAVNTIPKDALVPTSRYPPVTEAYIFAGVLAPGVY